MMRDDAKAGTEPAADTPEAVRAGMRAIGAEAKAAARALRLADPAAKTRALDIAAEAILRRQDALLEANAQDVAFAEAKGLAAPMIDRLRLDPKRIAGVAASVAAVAARPDPVGRVLAEWREPNGLTLRRVTTPIGVIGIIYESRPNVTADAGALCLKSGNAAILRGGSETFHSARAIIAALGEGLRGAALPEAAVQLVPTRDRAAVGVMLRDMADQIDVIVPRGGKSLVARVQEEARVPVFAHLEGVCHVYVDAAADLAKARAIVANAKMRRTSICGAAECLLVDAAAADRLLVPILEDLATLGCEIRADAAARALYPAAAAASDADFGREFLDSVIAVRVVDGVAGAIAHIEAHGSGHTEAIVTEDAATAQRFFDELDSAILFQNASTQFADGGEFGLGAEIGIATGKIHARGPVGADQLTTIKYVGVAEGATRP